MSRAGTPTDNPIIESINGWLKCEMKLDFDMQSYKHISAFLDDFVNYYNNDRPSCALGYLSPNEYRKLQGF